MAKPSPWPRPANAPAARPPMFHSNRARIPDRLRRARGRWSRRASRGWWSDAAIRIRWCSGRGIKILRAAGIEVTEGVLEDECQRLNEGFFTRVTRGRPFVTLKLATSLDGRIAAVGGDSRWISSPESRALVHQWRREADAVMVGAATVIADNPRLTCRIEGGRDPARIIIDGRLRSPGDFEDLSPALVGADDRRHDRGESCACRTALS